MRLSTDRPFEKAKPDVRICTPDAIRSPSAPAVASTKRMPSSALVRQRVVASALAVTASPATTVAATGVTIGCPLRASIRCAPRA
jgi:hypothetical protein